MEIIIMIDVRNRYYVEVPSLSFRNIDMMSYGGKEFWDKQIKIDNQTINMGMKRINLRSSVVTI